ncbi:MAG: thioredoxin family protein [Terriglobia bacterium]
MNPPKFWFFVVFLAAICCAATRRSAPVYDEGADAHHDIATAIANAGGSRKNIVLIFGANWCPDCRALDAQMRKPNLAAIVEGNYVVVKVDLGRHDKNLDLATQYHVPIERGIPALAVLDSHGNLLYAMDQGQFADARSMSYESIKAFFVQWKPKH